MRALGDAIDTEHDRLAINDELLMPILARRLNDPGVAIGPIVVASGDQATRSPSRSRPVVLHLVQPNRAVGDATRRGGQRKSKLHAHPRKTNS